MWVTREVVSQNLNLFTSWRRQTAWRLVSTMLRMDNRESVWTLYAFCLYQISRKDFKSFNVQHWDSSDAACWHHPGDWFQDAHFSPSSRISASQLSSRNWHLHRVCQGEFSHVICPSANQRVEINKCERLTRLYFRYLRFLSKQVCIVAGGILYLRTGSPQPCRRKVRKR